MHTTPLPGFVVVVSLAAFLSAGRNAVAAAQYAVTNLGLPPGCSSAGSSAINASGQVVGDLNANPGGSIFLYSNGSISDLGSFGGPTADATGISDTGQVVGWSPVNDDPRGFLYNAGNTVYFTVSGYDSSVAYGISPDGQKVVGIYYNLSIPKLYGFMYNNGTMTHLPAPPGPNVYFEPRAVNNNGQIVGRSAGTFDHAMIYFNGQFTDLGTLPGYDLSEAYAINSGGTVVGILQNSASELSHPFLYHDGTMIDLGSLPGYTFSNALAINDGGQVVGSCLDLSTYTEVAALYDNGSLTDLNTLIAPDSGWQLLIAYGINDSGQIVGFGHYNGLGRAFLLTPIPEPSAAVLAVFGAFPLLLLRNASVHKTRTFRRRAGAD